MKKDTTKKEKLESAHGLPFQHAQHDFTLIIFGASGSLAKLKIFPSLYQLQLENRLPVDFRIIGYARTEMTQEEFHKEFRASVREKFKDMTDEKILKKVLKNVSYVTGQYDSEADFTQLKAHIIAVEGKKKFMRLAYFSTPPSVFEAVITQLGKVNFNTTASKLRLIIEKPFGYDLKSAKNLEKILLERFDESQLFLLDHYLGKEAVFNLLSLRYANPILTTLIQGQYVRNIQINGLENLGTEGRANYFEHVGTLRDMIQSHLFQILAFLTMDLPEKITSETIHRGKRNLIESLVLKDKKLSVVRGQYRGYQKEEGVNPQSETETFASLRLFIDEMRWHNVPVYLRTGKKMKKQLTSVVIEFKPQALQKLHQNLEPNKLIIQLQPNEKIEFSLLTKMGGSEVEFTPLNTGRPIYCSGDCLDEHGRLLIEAIKGDKMLFLDFPEIYASWEFIDKIIDAFNENTIPLTHYDSGTYGPKESYEMLERYNHKWHDIE